jgi:hypothetical protein
MSELVNFDFVVLTKESVSTKKDITDLVVVKFARVGGCREARERF